jgi:hypothetical protein
MRHLLLAALASLVLAGCGEKTEKTGTAAAKPTPSGPAWGSLRVTVNDGAGHTREASLTCRDRDPTATGFLKDDPGRHCATARRLAGFLAAVASPHRVCAQVYGGPQTAFVRGRVDELSVGRSFDRENSCGTDDWEDAADLLGGVPRGDAAGP